TMYFGSASGKPIAGSPGVVEIDTDCTAEETPCARPWRAWVRYVHQPTRRLNWSSNTAEINCWSAAVLTLPGSSHRLTVTVSARLVSAIGSPCVSHPSTRHASIATWHAWISAVEEKYPTSPTYR